jgi:hypothetical protein
MKETWDSNCGQLRGFDASRRALREDKEGLPFTLGPRSAAAESERKWEGCCRWPVLGLQNHWLQHQKLFNGLETKSPLAHTHTFLVYIPHQNATQNPHCNCLHCPYRRSPRRSQSGRSGCRCEQCLQLLSLPPHRYQQRPRSWQRFPGMVGRLQLREGGEWRPSRDLERHVRRHCAGLDKSM